MPDKVDAPKADVATRLERVRCVYVGNCNCSVCFLFAQLDAANVKLAKLPNELHALAMNMRCDVGDFKGEAAAAYKIGHRDARHAIAEALLSCLTNPV